MELVFELEELPEVAIKVLDAMSDHKVLAIHGAMGAGKTTLIHALCLAKGVKDHVTSPSFAIINEYQFQEGASVGKIFHLDLYRLKDEEEAIRAGVEDCLYSGALCFVEWPDQAPDQFPQDTIHLFMTTINERSRSLKIQFPG